MESDAQSIEENQSEIDNTLVQTILNEINAVKKREEVEEVREIPQIPSQINSNYMPSQIPQQVQFNPIQLQPGQVPYNPMVHEQYAQQIALDAYNSHVMNLINNDNNIINRFVKNVKDMVLFMVLLITFSYLSHTAAVNMPIFATESEKTLNLLGISLISFLMSVLYIVIKQFM